MDLSPPVPQTTTPRACAAATSMAALRAPVVTSSFRSGRRARSEAGKAVRSRIASTISKPASASAASSSEAKGWVKGTGSTRPARRDQSPKRVATPW